MELLEIISQSGIVGAGGAGFPTHVKLGVKTEWLVVNGAECEPLIHCDKYLMRTRANDIVKTLLEMAEIIEAKNIVIGLKKAYLIEIEALNKAIGSHPISLCLMDSFYPAGDEQVLIYEATGDRVPIGKLPKDIGVTVSNVSTICDIADAIKGNNLTTRVLSIVGEVETPLILEVPIGISVLECIKEAKATLSRFSVILGGPMMGKIYSFEQLSKLPVTKTVNSIIVLPEGHYLEHRQNIKLEHMINQTNSACIQCRECTELCPRFLIGHPLHPHRVMRNIAMGTIETDPVFEESLLCCECGVCDYVCPMHLSPRRVNQMVKRALAGKKSVKGELRGVVRNRPFRKLSTTRLSYMIDVHKYKHQKPQEFRCIESKKVIIPLKQHIGKESSAIVSLNDVVKLGDLIAQVDPQALGANIHASISGKVIHIDQHAITIEKV